jgi:uncharacterized protein (TIGR00369 family)
VAIQVPPNCDLTLGLNCLEKSEAGTTTWRAAVDERFLNPAGVVQGGFLAAMLDSAMGASAVSAYHQRSVNVTNTEMNVSFLHSARPGDVLTCVATVLKPGRIVAFLESRITNQDGDLVARASSTFLIRERSE